MAPKQINMITVATPMMLTPAHNFSHRPEYRPDEERHEWLCMPQKGQGGSIVSGSRELLVVTTARNSRIRGGVSLQSAVSQSPGLPWAVAQAIRLHLNHELVGILKRYGWH